MTGKTAIIGDRDSALSFRAAGVDAFGATKETVADAIRRAARTHSVIFVTEDLLEGNEELLHKYDNAPYPIVLPVPGKEGSKGLGLRLLREAGERALGVDILYDREDK